MPGKVVVQGKDSLIHTDKDQKVVFYEESGNDGRMAEWNDMDVEFVSVTFGRTISLGNYEFARIGCGIKVGLPVPVQESDRAAAYRRMVDAVEEVLDREESYLRGEERESSDILLNGLGVNVAIWMDYGLTFKTRSMDSAKVDLMSSRRLTDGSDFEEQLNDLQSELGGKIGSYKAKILGEKDVG